MPRPRSRAHKRERTVQATAAPIALHKGLYAIGPLLLAVLFASLAIWSWRKWPDPFVDFGHELYIPWQLAEGRVLYRDIAYFMGPLSQYFNALSFVVFGASFSTLIWVNLSILAGITALIHTFFAHALGRAAAVFVSAVFLCVFAFSQYVGLGNYNYITPYLHEQTHGVALGLLLLFWLERLSRRPSAPRIAAAGTTLGLVFLTKAEAFVPAFVVAVVAGALLYVARRPAARQAAAGLLLFVTAAVAPVLIATGLLATQMPLAVAVRAVLGNWIYILDPSLTLHDPYYAHNLGLSSLHAQVGEILLATVRLAGFAMVALGLERVLKKRDGLVSVLAAGGLVSVILAVIADAGTWLDLARVLPVVSGAAAVHFTFLAWRDRHRPEFRQHFLLASWSVFAFVSLGKMLLRTRLGHYGFALAMPSALLLVALLVFVVPRGLSERRWSGQVWRAAAAAAVVVAVASLLGFANLYYRMKTLPVRAGADSFYLLDPRLDPRSEYFVAALETLRRDMPPSATLAVLPDGVLLNFLLRRANPTPYYLVTPWELRAFGGEEAIFARIAPAAPDYFVLAKLDMSEYGPRFFGFDPAYGQRLRLWLQQNYTSLATVGYEPITGRPWLHIYKRREGQAAATELPALGVGS